MTVNSDNVTSDFEPEAAVCGICSGECIIYRRDDGVDKYNKWCKDCKTNIVVEGAENLIWAVW